ncbi:MAG: phosphoglycerate dehydrogenase, partial [Cyclobacteriaceae bacterium]
MEANKFFIIDFDSTFTQVEALDVLGEISLANHPEKEERLQKIKDITDQGMDGGMSFRESLEKRVELLDAHKNDLSQLVDRLRLKVSESFKRNREFFETNKDHIFILSNGFSEFITPIVTEYGIK